MQSLCAGVVLAGFLSCLQMPFTHGASFFMPLHLAKQSAETGPVEQQTMAKRGSTNVDAWSICPPHMTDVDCFYAYLRVYARLRKAAEESDRVSMRNIGKRESVTSPDVHLTSSSLSDLCPFDMSPAQCYQVANTLYMDVLAMIRNAARVK